MKTSALAIRLNQILAVSGIEELADQIIEVADDLTADDCEAILIAVNAYDNLHHEEDGYAIIRDTLRDNTEFTIF